MSFSVPPVASYALCRPGTAPPSQRVIAVASAADPRSLALHPLATLSLPCGDVLEDWVLCADAGEHTFYEVFRVERPAPLVLGARVGALTLSSDAFARAHAFLSTGLLDLSPAPELADALILDPPIAPLMSEGLDPELAASWRLDQLLCDPDAHSGLVGLLSLDPTEEDLPLSSLVDSDPDSDPFDHAASLDGDPLLPDLDDSASGDSLLDLDPQDPFDPSHGLG